MDQRIETSPSPQVIIDQVLGNLEAKGWETPAVEGRARPDVLNLTRQEEDCVRLSCRGSCELRLPQAANVQLESAHGEARFKNLTGGIKIATVHGSLSLKDIASAEIETVHGEMYAKRLTGTLLSDQVLGNAFVRAVEGSCQLNNVLGNLDLRDVAGDLTARAHGNVRLRLSQVSAKHYEINAQGNFYLRIPPDASLSLSLASESELIYISLPSEQITLRKPAHELKLGDGAAIMRISAGGSVYVTTSSFEGEWAEDVDIPDLENLTGEIGEQIDAQVRIQMEAMTSQLNEQMSRLSEQLGRAGMATGDSQRIMEQARRSSEQAVARAQEKMRRAQERLGQRMESAQRRAEVRTGHHGWGFTWNTPPAPPQPPSEPVKEQERLLILKMLEQKKISLEDAENLLAALEGKEG